MCEGENAKSRIVFRSGIGTAQCQTIWRPAVDYLTGVRFQHKKQDVSFFQADFRTLFYSNKNAFYAGTTVKNMKTLSVIGHLSMTWQMC